VTNGFHARVIAARLGSEGFVTQLRGGVDSPYPMGEVEVLVREDDLADVSALLLADEVESAFDDELDDDVAPRARLALWIRAVLVLFLGLVVWADAAAYF
jgi:hypothetical protein